MSQADLSRIKDDLETIKQATGLDSPYGKKEVGFIFLIGFFALLTSLWYILDHPYPLSWGVFFLFGATMGVIIALARCYRFRYGRSLWGKRKFLVTFLLLLFAIYIYGMCLATPGAYSSGQATFIVGMVAMAVALLSHNSREVWGLAIPLMLAGLMMPRVSIDPFLVFSLAFTISCLVMGIIIWLNMPNPKANVQ